MKDIGSVIGDVLRYKNRYLKKQITIGTKKYNNEEINVILAMLKLVHYNSLNIEIEQFLIIKNKEINEIKNYLTEQRINITKINDLTIDKLYKEVLDLVFSGSDFYDKYNNNNNLNMLEKFIPIKKENYNKMKKVLVVGGSGSGKTTFIKNLLGFENEEILAISNGNTTLGNNNMVLVNGSKECKFGMVFKKKYEILNFFSKKSFILISKTLEENYNISKKEIYRIISSGEKSKWKFENLIKEEDIDEEIIEILKNITKSCEQLFFKTFNDKMVKGSSYKNLIKNNQNYEKDFLLFIEEFKITIEKKSDFTFKNLESKFYTIINRNFNKEIFNIYNDLKEIALKNNEEFSLKLYFDEGLITLDNKNILVSEKKFEDGWKLNILNFATESLGILKDILNVIFKKEKGVFSLIEDMRILGDFYPTELDKSFRGDSTIIIEDSEGIGHDISSKEYVSLDIQKKICESDKIIITYNMSTAEAKENFVEILKKIINIGAFYKVNFLFTKIDALTLNNSSNDLKKVEINKILKDYLYNCFEKIKEDGLSYIQPYRDVDNILKEKSFILGDMRSKVEIENSFSYLSNEIIRCITEEKEKLRDIEVIPQLKKFYCWINREVDNSLFKEQLNSKNLSVDKNKLAILAYRAQNIFVEEFIENIESKQWQTIKAFNNRMAYNYDYRSWNGIEPEAVLNYKSKFIIRNYLITDWINKMEIAEKEFFIDYIDYLVDIMSIYFFGKFEEIVYKNLLEDWKLGVSDKCKGEGSTTKRQKIIISLIKDKFYIENDIFKEKESLYNILIDGLIYCINQEKIKIKFN